MEQNEALIEELNGWLRAQVKRSNRARDFSFLKILAVAFLALGASFFLFLTVSAFNAAGREFSLEIANAKAPEPPNISETLGSVAAAAWQMTLASEEKLAGEAAGRINIVFLGMAGEPNPSPYLTDTTIVVSIEPKSGRAAIVSVPRDLYVKTAFAPFGARINSLYQHGLLNSDQDPEQFILDKLEEITGLKINYWMVIDLSAVVAIADALGGIDIYVPEKLYDPLFPGPNFSYEPFGIEAGFQHVDGLTAAKYARSRHSPNGDFDRIARQREVVEAVARKVKALNPVWNFSQLVALYEGLYGHIATNFTPAKAKRLFELVKDITGKNFYSATLSADPETGALAEENYYGAAVLVPKAGYENYSQVQTMFQKIFEQF